jgi:hypothetical protein
MQWVSYTDVVGVLHLECDLQGNVGRELHQYSLFSPGPFVKRPFCHKAILS